jgi:hypothetical protein
MRKGLGVIHGNRGRRIERSNTMFLGCAMDAMMDQVMNVSFSDGAADAVRRAL